MVAMYQMMMPPERRLFLVAVVALNHGRIVVRPRRRRFEKNKRFQLTEGQTSEVGGAEAGAQPLRLMLLLVVQETRVLPRRLDPRG